MLPHTQPALLWDVCSLATNADHKGYDSVMVGTRKEVSYTDHLIMLPSYTKVRAGNAKPYGKAPEDTSVARLYVLGFDGAVKALDATLMDLRKFANGS